MTPCPGCGRNLQPGATRCLWASCPANNRGVLGQVSAQEMPAQQAQRAAGNRDLRTVTSGTTAEHLQHALLSATAEVRRLTEEVGGLKAQNEELKAQVRDLKSAAKKRTKKA